MKYLGTSDNQQDFVTKDYIDNQLKAVSKTPIMQSLTKQEYNALATKDANTVYLIKDNAYANRLN